MSPQPTPAPPAPPATGLDPAAVVRAFRQAGFGPFTGVPCSFLGPVISCLQQEAPDSYLIASNEGEAVAVAAGARLAGRTPVVILQNSGLGNTVNPVTSLLHTLRIPVLLLVTWRGEPGRPDEPQHELMGRITPALLDAMEVRNEPFPARVADLDERLAVAAAHMRDTGLPFAFVVPKGAIGRYGGAPAPAAGPGLMLRAEAIDRIMRALDPRTLVVATTGKTARELERDRDRPGNLYVVGSMGCASSVALGVALHAPGRPVAVLDGDGAALMRLEAVVGIGHHAPANLLHVVLDNAAYESTGAQPTASPGVDLTAVALACGYRYARDVSTADGLDRAVGTAAAAGPAMVRVRIAPGSDPALGRPALAPPDSAARFQKEVRS
ncbi:phosphonopyruvate decarboxylase [Streptomyces sp. TRM76323]|uniref:Phosphonopyruvate decarboxylase n=1 Tax=Streptomyces tamarix TaxID=3078565 RepID=A0ABU3QI44_9ACTN|nr:phosphonopyruvate decarboxylase [Streptomyces tamarix]MDT9682409.1 phosphonopyruvate decarboxylase [Streptomyces tamarix]